MSSVTSRSAPRPSEPTRSTGTPPTPATTASRARPSIAGSTTRALVRPIRLERGHQVGGFRGGSQALREAVFRVEFPETQSLGGGMSSQSEPSQDPIARAAFGQIEARILRKLLLNQRNRRDLRLFRNTVGMFRKPDGSAVKYGLGEGTSDLVGFRSLTVTEEMVGRTIAQFVAVEVKTPTGKVSEMQRAFLALVQRMGGYAVVARSEDVAI